MYSWVDILFSLSFYRGCEGKGSSYQLERKDSWSHYVSDTNSITPSMACAAQHFLNFISAAALPHPPFSESPTPQRTNSTVTSHCSISTSWEKGASQAERRAHVRLGGPVQPYSSLLPITEFQAILETTLVLKRMPFSNLKDQRWSDMLQEASFERTREAHWAGNSSHLSLINTCIILTKSTIHYVSLCNRKWEVSAT